MASGKDSVQNTQDLEVKQEPESSSSSPNHLSDDQSSSKKRSLDELISDDSSHDSEYESSDDDKDDDALEKEGHQNKPIYSNTNLIAGVRSKKLKYTEDVEKYRVKIPDGLIRCPICNKYETKCLPQYRKHIAAHREENPIQCPFCDYSTGWDTKQNFKSHLYHAHAEEKLECPYCDFKTGNIPSYNRHKLSHTKILKCGYCSYETSCVQTHREHTARHESTKLTDLVGLEDGCDCPCCAERFNEVSVYNKHLAEHATKHELSCKRCFYTTHNLKNFRRHMLITHRIIA